MKFVILAFVSWLIGVFGWSQIVGSFQNIRHRKSLIFTIVIWAGVLYGAGFVIGNLFGCPKAVLTGYAVSLLIILGRGRIE